MSVIASFFRAEVQVRAILSICLQIQLQARLHSDSDYVSNNYDSQ